MLSLPSDLDALCLSLFLQCEEFESAQDLRALFVTTELAPFADGLPERTGSKRAFVARVKLFLLEKRLTDGRVLLLPFLDTLRGSYPEQEALHGDLNDLYQRVLVLTQPAPSLPPPISLNHHYICYALRDGAWQAERLHTALQQAGARAWLDRRDTPAGYDPEAAREDALRECASVLLVLTPASANVQSESAGEWRKALQYKKPIIPVRFAPGVGLPLMLGRRTVLDFTGPLDKALADLRRHLDDLTTPAGQVRELEYRLADAEHELRVAPADERARIERDVTQLEAELIAQRAVARDPQAAARAAEKRTEAALERERQPEGPAVGRGQTKFINPPPLLAPSYFQDRHIENSLIAKFLRDSACRLLTVAGRGGVGKTAMVCRLLKALEAGHLPDDLGELPVSGIVYLSAVGSHRVSFPNLHADLLRLLPADRAQPLAALYQDPQKSVADKLTLVWEVFAEVAQAPVIVLLDNVEDLLDLATHAFTDTEVDAALRSLLDAPPHPVKVLLTTRVPPREILLLHPERQLTVPLDEGLSSPYAEAVLRAGDPTGVLKLKDAPDERLASAREYTRGYPRALEAITAALNADRAATLEDLLAGPPPANVVEALVGQAYSRLDATSQKVMQALAVFGRPVPPAAVDYLLQPYLPGLDCTPVLNRLVNMRFVTKEAGRYYMHPVDREYALQRLPSETEVDRDALKSDKRMQDLFRLVEKPGAAQSPISSLSSPAHPFTLSPLLARAADYFRATRTPRAAWKTLADLAPQLAEIDLRYAAGDYDTAAQVLTDIGFSYLLLWGHYRLMIDQHERLQGKLSDARLKYTSVHNLGIAYDCVGQIPKAIAYCEQALALVREAKDRQAESATLGSLGNGHFSLGQTHRAIEAYEQALAIDREIGNRKGEGAGLGNLGICYAALGQTRRATESYEQALTIKREIGDRNGEGVHLGNLAEVLIGENRYAEAVQRAISGVIVGEEIGSVNLGNFNNAFLALAHLYSGDLPAARVAAEQARQYDEPKNNHNVLALLGVIALRQDDLSAAREAFTAALAHAEGLLALTPENYDALDARALAFAGLGEIGDAALFDAARAAYQAARTINSEAGVVQRAVRLLNELEGVPKFWE
jgi:tetratricopeptide (TPR) repeat protein